MSNIFSEETDAAFGGIGLPEGTTKISVGSEKNSFNICFGNDGMTRYENFVTGVKVEVKTDDLMLFVAREVEKFAVEHRFNLAMAEAHRHTMEDK